MAGAGYARKMVLQPLEETPTGTVGPARGQSVGGSPSFGVDLAELRGMRGGQIHQQSIC